MTLRSRRAFLGVGVGASLWCTRGMVAAGSAAANSDGIVVLEASPTTLPLGTGAPTPALGYNGDSPGPLLRIRHGESLKLRLVNKLETPTTVSFPGLRAANAQMGFGGLTQPMVAPGASLETRVSPPNSGFNVYLPHAGKSSASQIARGLFGPIVVDEIAPPQVDLDAIVVLSDWRLGANGEVADLDDADLARGGGRFGATISANGALAPLALSAAPGARVRMRIANAATARVMTFAIEGVKTQIIAVDGQPSEPFEPLRNLVPMGPGARFELLFDLPRVAGATARFILRGGEAGAIPGEADRPVIVIETKGEAVVARGGPPALPINPRLPAEIALERSHRVDLTLSGGGQAPLAINGIPFADWAPKPAFAVSRGTPVTLGLVNKTQATQAIRINGHVARLLHAMDDGWEPYWRDILLVQPGKTIHAAFVADNPGKWPIESASPERRDAGLATWFQVM